MYTTLHPTHTYPFYFSHKIWFWCNLCSYCFAVFCVIGPHVGPSNFPSAIFTGFNFFLVLLTFKNVNCDNWFVSFLPTLFWHFQIYTHTYIAYMHPLFHVLSPSPHKSVFFSNSLTSVFLSYMCTCFVVMEEGWRQSPMAEAGLHRLPTGFMGLFWSVLSIIWWSSGVHWNPPRILPFYLQFYCLLCLSFT